MKSQRSTTVTVTDDEPSMAVIELVAEATGTDPIELTPLYDVIDPEAIDALGTSAGFSSLEFEYAGHTVVLEASGDDLEISLEPVTIGTGSPSVPDAGPSA